MRIQLTVVFRLKHPQESPQPAAFFADARAMLSSIEGVQQFIIQRQVSKKSDLTHQFSMVFVDAAASTVDDVGSGNGRVSVSIPSARGR